MDSPSRVSVYQPLQAGLKFPELPRFESPAADRLHRKQRLAAACRAFAHFKFDFGFGGHLTVRDPERPELYWTNPMAVHFSQVKVSNLILVDHRGTVVEGDYAVNQAGFVLHAAIHEANPDIVAVCHAHTVHGTAFAAMGRPLEPITQDACAFYGDHVVITDDAGAVAVEPDAGKRIAKAFGGNKAAIHQNHGLLTASRHSIDEAAWWFIALDTACRVQLLADASRTPPTRVSEENARYSREHVGNWFIGWLHFQPVYDQILAANPDMFD
ncbi:MAG: class II aldolase/adducin family protein [Rhodospirillaceae bacterium]|nr:class II aldolase/adducin family protein [Rhodospirillaceae bacterium]